MKLDILAIGVHPDDVELGCILLFIAVIGNEVGGEGPTNSLDG